MLHFLTFKRFLFKKNNSYILFQFKSTLMQAKQNTAKNLLTFKPKTGSFTRTALQAPGGSSFPSFLLWQPLSLALLLVLSSQGLHGKLDPSPTMVWNQELAVKVCSFRLFWVLWCLLQLHHLLSLPQNLMGDLMTVLLKEMPGTF